MIVQIARKHQIGYDDFKSLLGIATGAQKLKGCYPPGVMPFGKYEGATIEQIYLKDPDYLDWVLREATCRNNLKQQILAFLKTKQN